MLIPPPPNCATTSLDVYTPSAGTPWNSSRVQHLARRLGFSITAEDISAALAQSPDTLVDALIDTAINTPNLTEPIWSDWGQNDYDDFVPEATAQSIAYSKTWIATMLTNGVKEKITLFWHNHFVTRIEDYFCPSWLYSYHTLLQDYALGNFRDFVYEMGKTPAMLVFLNGVQNTRIDPNENYARELFELFTLGQDNGYTQADIVDAARALTGYNGFTTACAPITFVEFLHDTAEKTIFGQTGNWGYDELHNILFTQRASEIAHYICGKIYKHFVHPEIKEEIVAGLAQTLLDNNWELVPVFRQLFKSEHFFDEYIIGVQIKSPLDLLNNLVKELGLEHDDSSYEFILNAGYQLNQGLFNPVDVAGWPGDRDWINTSTITGRWQITDFILFNTYENSAELLQNLAQTLTSVNENDPALITQAIIDFFIPKALLNPQQYADATLVFKWEVPQNYYDSGQWNLLWDTVPAQVALLLRHISRFPEFQLS